MFCEVLTLILTKVVSLETNHGQLQGSEDGHAIWG